MRVSGVRCMGNCGRGERKGWDKVEEGERVRVQGRSEEKEQMGKG